MKKLIYFSLALMVAATTLPSCNKKLKEDIKELDQQVADLQSKNSSLESKNSELESTLNNVNGGLEVNNPITWTFSGKDGSTTVSKTYTVRYLLDVKSEYQYISESDPGIWEVYVEKAEDINWSDYADFDIYVNASSNTLASGYGHSVYGYHYDEYDGGYSIYARAYNGYGTITANSLNVNTTTGDVTVDLNWSNDGYTFGSDTESGTMKWTGKCFVY